jgi:DNA-binding NtrC family response regulator
MSVESLMPRVLIVDDLFGRTHSDARNEERANLCAQYLLRDVTGDEIGKGAGQRVLNPVAEAIFFRGQRPLCAHVGDRVENDLEAVLRLVGDGWTSPGHAEHQWSMLLLDLCFYSGVVTASSDRRLRGMPEGTDEDASPQHYFGLKILRAIHREFPELPVVILSSKPREDVNREFSANGALGFLDRSGEDAADMFRDYLWRHGLIPDYSGLIVGKSRSLLLALRIARRAARNRRNILLRGQRGTGKELFASFIHRYGTNPSGPFEIVDSGALSPQLYASELFGHKKGAFTGADTNRVGRLAEARGGDLFLDEIANMPLEVQLGLLRAIEYRSVTPLGGNSGDPVDVRFISATNGDVERWTESGQGFRQDLLDRLRESGTIFLPSLADRKEDIPDLIRYYVFQAEQSILGAFARQIDPSVFEWALNYEWPGNIRELRNLMFNAVSQNPDVEYMVPLHLGLSSPRSTKMDSTTELANLHVVQSNRDQSGLLQLRSLLRALSAFDFNSLRRSDLEGLLPTLQESEGRVIAQYLKTVLAATAKPLEGRIQIHPAIKVAMGDASVSASKAAGIIKSLLKNSSQLGDQTLMNAYEIATRLRPNQPKGKKAQKDINIAANSDS